MARRGKERGKRKRNKRKRTGPIKRIPPSSSPFFNPFFHK